MKTYAELIEDLAWRRRSAAAIFAELRQIEAHEDAYTLPLAAVRAVIHARIAGEISEKELVAWASFFECRDEVDYYDDERAIITELIFFLANPEINYSLTLDNLTMMLRESEKNEN